MDRTGHASWTFSAQPQTDHPSFDGTTNLAIRAWLSRHEGQSCRYSCLVRKELSVFSISFLGLKRLLNSVSGSVPQRPGTVFAGAQETKHFQQTRTGPPLGWQQAHSRCLVNAGELWHTVGTLERLLCTKNTKESGSEHYYLQYLCSRKVSISSTL